MSNSKVVSLCDYRSKKIQGKYRGAEADYWVLDEVAEIPESAWDIMCGSAPDNTSYAHDTFVLAQMVCECCRGDQFLIYQDNLDNTTAVCHDCGHRHLIF